MNDTFSIFHFFCVKDKFLIIFIGFAFGAIAAKIPFLPSIILVALEKLFFASKHASIPSWAAFAGCSCFDIAPSFRNSHNPAVIVPAEPMAIKVCSLLNFEILEIAAATPIVPAVPVVCQNL